MSPAGPVNGSVGESHSSVTSGHAGVLGVQQADTGTVSQGQCHRGSVTAWGCCVPQSLGLSAVLWIPKFSSRESVDSTGAFPLEGSLTMPVLPGGADPKAFKTRRNSDESRHQRLIIPPNG